MVAAGAWLLGAAAAEAAGPTDPDWPCIQRKVPEISAGMVWAGPPVEDLDDAWRKDPEVAQLARGVAARRTPLDQAREQVAAFAAELSSGKDRRLTLLFTGILSTINGERASIIGGIQRYARRQARLAEKIQRQTDELNRLPAQGSDEQEFRRQELEEMRGWDTRIFEERERSLAYICEQPVLLEQRLFALAREIMNHLD